MLRHTTNIKNELRKPEDTWRGGGAPQKACTTTLHIHIEGHRIKTGWVLHHVKIS